MASSASAELLLVLARHAKWLSIILLIGAWSIDMVTPTSLVAAILLTIPVALSSVFLQREFTGWIVATALVADVVAGVFNHARDGGPWDSIAIANRALAAFSIVLVGMLGDAARSAAERSGTLAARQRQAERSEAIRRAFERIRASLNVDLVARAIVRESIATLGAESAALYMLDSTGAPDICYRYGSDAADVSVDRAPPPAALGQFLRRAVDRRSIVELGPDDPVARFCLQELATARAYVLPLSDGPLPIPALVLSAGQSGDLQADTAVWMRAFAEQAGIALAQASVFVELGRKNDALATANRSIDERGQVIRDIVYALSHDLRTPLAAAAMTMHQALEGKYGPLSDAYRDILRRSIEANSELRRLAETLLMVARYESGEQSRVRAPVQLGELARNVVDELEPLWGAKGVRVRVGDDEAAVAAGDVGELRRAAMNLIANAVSWTPEGGTVVVDVRRHAGGASLSVRDDGYGVPAAERAVLFERQVSRQAPRTGSGSGLGLYIVRRIAESHGGTVTYAPVEPRGSEFTLTLPAVAEAPAHV